MASRRTTIHIVAKRRQQHFTFCLGHRLKADGDNKSRLQVEYTLVYVTSVNAFIKKAIERGKSMPCSFSLQLHNCRTGYFST